MPTDISKILLATDGSDGALRAAKFAARLAAPLQARITILTVHDDDLMLYEAMGPAMWPAPIPDATMDIEAFKRACEQRAVETTLAEAQAALGDFTNVEPVQVWGHGARTICEYAATGQFDLIVIGSRGRSAFARLLLGSVSAQVAQHAPCPVTIVH
jgi:nucleotide-binding universal stress UspA family protein